MSCNLCNGVGWVCVDHLDHPIDWEKVHCTADPDCGEAFCNCVCNPNALMPEGFKTLAAVEGIDVKDWVQ